MTVSPNGDPTDRVTLGNWRQAPFSTKSFHDVGTLIPIAQVEAGRSPSPLQPDPQPIDRIAFEDADGRERPIGDIFETSFTRGLVVLRGGRIVAERYGMGYDGTRPHLLFSVSKSITGALAGILVDRGVLDPDGPVTRHLPEVASSAYGDCSLRNVLDMTVSASFSEEYDDLMGDYGNYRRATLWNPPLPGADPGTLHGFLAAMPRAAEPHGEIFRYLSPNSDLLGWVLERAAGQPFAELLSQHIWQRIGAEHAAQITVDGKGSARSAGGICMLPRDLARFGEMMRLNGMAQGRVVVPDWWVHDIRTAGDRAPWRRGTFYEQFPNGGYRSQWYQTGGTDDPFCAIGIHGQWLWIDPEREVVIAKVSAQPEPFDEAIDMTLIRAFPAVCAAL